MLIISKKVRKDKKKTSESIANREKNKKKDKTSPNKERNLKKKKIGDHFSITSIVAKRNVDVDKLVATHSSNILQILLWLVQE